VLPSIPLRVPAVWGLLRNAAALRGRSSQREYEAVHKVCCEVVRPGLCSGLMLHAAMARIALRTEVECKSLVAEYLGKGVLALAGQLAVLLMWVCLTV
jgi:hypothetical protein